MKKEKKEQVNHVDLNEEIKKKEQKNHIDLNEKTKRTIKSY